MRIERLSEPLVKSRRRVADHGEVLTPAWMVGDMLDLVKAESERIDSRVLEPACGSGNFLVPVLRRKLATVEARYGMSDFERRHHALLALMCLYGIELLAEHVAECRANLLEVFAAYLGVAIDDPWHAAAEAVLAANIVQGDALDMTIVGTSPETHGHLIVFPEWAYLGKGKFRRRDFQYESLTQRAAFQAEDSLFQHIEEHEIFAPTKTYHQMTVEELAA
jgi:hypothetical protein